MEQIKALTQQNISTEHICCAISDKKCLVGYNAKKAWLKNQLEDAYVFKKLAVRGKVFIEYVPAEKGWVPIIASDYMLINCFWVSGKYKGKAYGKALYDHCVKDSQGKNGIVVVVGDKKKPFMSEKKFFVRQGFELCDTAAPYFELWYKSFKKNAPIPRFKEIAKQGTSRLTKGIEIYYTAACPFTDYYVKELESLATKKGYSVSVIHLKTREQAQNHFVPHTIYSVFQDGKFVTQHIINKKSFDKFIK